MRRALSFRSVCAILKDDFKELGDDTDALLGLLAITSTAIIASPIAALIPAIGLVKDAFEHKDAISAITKKVLGKLSDYGPGDTLSDARRMEAAYVITCYSAFFEALEDSLPELMSMINITSKEQVHLSTESIKKLGYSKDEELNIFGEKGDFDPFNTDLSLPHPADSFDSQKDALKPLYIEMADAFSLFLQGLAVWENATQEQRSEVSQALAQLPDQALDHFDGLYFSLALRFNEFFVWSNLQAHQDSEQRFKELSGFARRQVDLARESKRAVDVGFQKLAVALEAMPGTIDQHHANTTLQELNKYYTSYIEQPIVRNGASPASASDSIKYPLRSEIFIPQTFNVLRYRKGQRLEHEGMWMELPEREDLGAFLLSYLSSPISHNTPLVILGHPGSGKSLLTSVLAARLVSPAFTPIRVELRGINAENEIPVQIEDQIRSITSRNISWALLTDHFDERPPLVILDGYDELLQASGKVFANYLEKVRLFQENELSLGRKPVRVMVTSRVTLIDKADVPADSTVIRLLEFGVKKQKKWISIWNTVNKPYFRKTDVKSFSIPEDENVKSLAMQPLLLLMLAIYDSDANALRGHRNLSRTLLYHNLLTRFVEREAEKDELYKNLSKEDKESVIDRNMKSLGAAALGMFNRRALAVGVADLNKDLRFFKLDRTFDSAGGSTLSPAELLVGGFFFVQESKALTRSEESGDAGVDTAFEFLHNTFGEFLTASFILDQVVEQTDMLLRSSGDAKLRGMAERAWIEGGTAAGEWYASLSYAPLFMRPVILGMMKEWLPTRIAILGGGIKPFLDELDWIVGKEIERTLRAEVVPSGIAGSEYPVGPMPLIGRLSIYSVNLVAIRTILSPLGFMFDEDAHESSGDGARAWDRLSHLWRSWFSLETLNGLSAIFSARRKGEFVALNARQDFVVPVSTGQLDMIANVGSVLADGVIESLAGISRLDAYASAPEAWSRIEELLNQEGIELGLELLVKRLRAVNADVFVGYGSDWAMIDIIRSFAESSWYLVFERKWELLVQFLDEIEYWLSRQSRVDVEFDELTYVFRFVLRSLYDLISVEDVVPKRVVESAVKLYAHVGFYDPVSFMDFRYLLERMVMIRGHGTFDIDVFKLLDDLEIIARGEVDSGDSSRVRSLIGGIAASLTG